MIEGKAIKFQDNIDTDQIIGAHHLVLPSIADMAAFTFEHHNCFTEHFQQGDILVATENFGCGSSREQAPAVLVERGVGAIIAVSFARIFFRNALNLGLVLVECDKALEIEQFDKIIVEKESVRNLTQMCAYDAVLYQR